eukprot:scaffold12862_cov116-Isochrysis_galbana.AAC.2
MSFVWASLGCLFRRQNVAQSPNATLNAERAPKMRQTRAELAEYEYAERRRARGFDAHHTWYRRIVAEQVEQ